MAAPAQPSVPREIRILGPDGAARPVQLDRARVTLGRSTASELCFADDAGLSRQHLAFEPAGDSWIVRDLGSKNGTLVNGLRIEAPHLLRPGDRVSAGHLVIEFGAAPSPANTVIFVDPQESPSGTDSTVITSLSGILQDDEKSVPGLESNPQVRALVRAGRELAGHRPLAELFTLIMDLSIDAVGAARGVLMTLEGEDLVVRAARGDGFRISNAVRDRVLRDKSSLLVRDARLDKIFKESMSIVEQQVRSMLAVPLQTDDRVIGLIYLDSPHFVHEFTKEDLNLLTVMANVAAIRIEHARLAEVEATERLLAREMSQAAEIQRRLLPAAAPHVAGLDLAGYNAACRTVGGDYYDFIPYPDGRAALVVADVAGKGMPAALLMSSLQARVQVIFDEPGDLAHRVTRLNRAVSANCPGNRFITFFACVLDPKAGTVTYCNAGHNPPILVKPDGSSQCLSGGGIILGIMAAAAYEETTVAFEKGDVLVLFSDGVTEACPLDKDEEFGEQRLAEEAAALRHLPAASITEELIAKVNAFTLGAPAADDVTLVVARST